MIRIILAEDHNLVRAGIRSLLQNMEGITVLAEAADGLEALRLATLHQPDVMLVDVTMPGINGLEATAQIAEDTPQVRVIILSMHANEAYVQRALRVGARGYLLKDAYASELEVAIRAVMRGEVYLSPAVAKLLVTNHLRHADALPESNPLDLLTNRQRQILQMIAEGHTTRSIAGALGISTKTVARHREELMQRLDIYDTAGLIRFAMRSGLVNWQN